jgi:hypothetical protein
MVTELSPLVNEHVAEGLYHRAASAWYHGHTLEIPNGTGGYVDLTKLFEQYRMLATLANPNFDPEKDNHGHV